MGEEDPMFIEILLLLTVPCIVVSELTFEGPVGPFPPQLLIIVLTNPVVDITASVSADLIKNSRLEIFIYKFLRK
jgi:hypothetical protein